MYIESDVPFDPALHNPDIRISVHRSGSDVTTAIEYEAFARDGIEKTVRFKSYDAGGAIVWIVIAQSLLEEAVFGEIHVENP